MPSTPSTWRQRYLRLSPPRMQQQASKELTNSGDEREDAHLVVDDCCDVDGTLLPLPVATKAALVDADDDEGNCLEEAGVCCVVDDFGD